MTTTSPAGAQAPAAGPIITEPGIYEMTNEQYHADPVPGGSLSSSGARKLLAPSCPARFRHDQLHGQGPRRTFDFGTAAHQQVLGNGPELVLIQADDYRTKAAQTARDEARLAGQVPLLPAEYEQVQAMAAAIRHHPVASALLAEGSGTAEQSLFWADQATGVWRRARPDWLPHPTGRRMVLPDYKTTVSADLDSISKAVHNYGYHQQADWYLSAARALGLADESAVFAFIFQEKTAPYLINVVQLDPIAMRAGRRLNRQAIATYQACTTSGQWPGYSDRVEFVSLPAWAEKQESQ